MLTPQDKALLRNLSYTSLFDRIWEINKLLACIYLVSLGWIITLLEYILYHREWTYQTLCANFAKEQVKLWNQNRSVSRSIKLPPYHRRLHPLLSRLQRATVHIASTSKTANKDSVSAVSQTAKVVAAFINHLCVEEARLHGNADARKNAAEKLGGQALFNSFNEIVVDSVCIAIYYRYIVEAENFVDFLSDDPGLKLLRSLRFWLASEFNAGAEIDQQPSLDAWINLLATRLAESGLYFPADEALGTQEFFSPLKKNLREWVRSLDRTAEEWKTYIYEERKAYLLGFFTPPFGQTHHRPHQMLQIKRYCQKITGDANQAIELYEKLKVETTEERQKDLISRFASPKERMEYSIVRLLSAKPNAQIIDISLENVQEGMQ
jgi:hypothetical protein